MDLATVAGNEQLHKARSCHGLSITSSLMKLHGRASYNFWDTDCGANNSSLLSKIVIPQVYSFISLSQIYLNSSPNRPATAFLISVKPPSPTPPLLLLSSGSTSTCTLTLINKHEVYLKQQ